MRISRKMVALGAIVSLGLVATACGDDDSTSSEDTTAVAEETTATEDTTMTADTTAAATEDTAAPAAETIVDIAAGNPDFSVLVELLTSAGLVETLAGEGPFTVFAPTNAAFEALAADLGTDIEGFKAQVGADAEALAKVLTSHVYAGKVMAADTAALDGAEVDMVSGEKATVSSKDGAVSLTIGASVANVVTADVEASNGVIHIVDKPLLPLELQD
jgi:transforming growth factor-beta-induced protein